LEIDEHCRCLTQGYDIARVIKYVKYREI